MISKQTIKYIRSLSLKKYRDAEKCFVAEGPKVVADLLPLLPCRDLYATKEFLATLSSQILERAGHVVEVVQEDLERLSLLKTPRAVLAVFSIPQHVHQNDLASLRRLAARDLCLALDCVQDPGNVGTIVRAADWFGIEHIFASFDTADVYAPKVVQATMGAIGRVKVHYVSLPDLLAGIEQCVPVYGTFLDGKSIYSQTLEPKGIIVMGNEGNGICDNVAQFTTHRLHIPHYPPDRSTSESLNVAVATAIVCSAFRCQQMADR